MVDMNNHIGEFSGFENPTQGVDYAIYIVLKSDFMVVAVTVV